MLRTSVTITGADDATDLDELHKLSRKFPFVEWAFLYSASRAGTPRYPSLSWLEEVVFWRMTGVHTALHVCGAASRQTLGGSGAETVELASRLGFDRVQLNGWTPASSTPFALFKDHRLGVILQTPPATFDEAAEVALYAAAPTAVLVDASGGRGIPITTYPLAPSGGTVQVGYAGGIVPATVPRALQAALLAGGSWIDMESGVRTDDQFDLGKVEVALLAAATYFTAPTTKDL